MNDRIRNRCRAADRMIAGMKRRGDPEAQVMREWHRLLRKLLNGRKRSE